MKSAFLALSAFLMPMAASAQAIGEPVDLVPDASVARTPDGLFAVAPNYLARFEDRRFVFLPSRGSEASGDGEFGLHLERLSRGAQTILEGDPAPPTSEGQLVTYAHEGGVLERYEARPDAVYLSVVVSERPTGSGDLVASFALDGEFLPRSTADGLALLDETGNGVSIGDVFGVDADGRRIEGAARFVEGALHLILPEEFVESARYPLVIDPPIGSATQLTILATDDRPDVAYDLSNDVYLVVWQRAISAGTRAILARRVSAATGLAVGPAFVVRQQTNVTARNPAVASVNSSNRFAVAWQERFVLGSPDRIVVSAVDAGAQASVTPHVTVHSSGNAQADVALAGERTTLDDDVLVAWDEEGVGIQLEQVGIAFLGDPATIASPTLIAPDSILASVSSPALPQSGGDTGRALLTWTTRSFVAPSRIAGRVVTRDAVALGAGSQLLSNTAKTWDVFSSTVDGDGSEWAVGFQEAPTTSTLIRSQVVRSRWDGSSLLNSLDYAVMIGVDVGEDLSADFGWTGNTLGIAASMYTGTGNFAQVCPLDTLFPIGCRIDDLASNIDGHSIAVGVEYAGGGSVDAQVGLVAWDRFNSTGGYRHIYIQRYGTGGTGSNLGGGCGPGGTLFAPCPFEGAGFRPRIVGANSGAIGILAYSTQVSTGFACGPCNFRPAINPLLTLQPAAGVSPDGSMLEYLPIPIGTAGIGVVLQVITVNPSPVNVCPTNPAVSFSNAVSISILP